MAKERAIVDRAAAAAAIDAFLRAMGRGDEPDVAGTGDRVAEMFANDLLSGYAIDTKKLVSESAMDASPSASGSSSALIIVHDIPVVTTCPHHLVPSMGNATVAFQAKTRIMGLGTVVALVDAHARRLALQEKIGDGVIADIDAVLDPEWVGCRIVLKHACMIARGERATNTSVETLALRAPSDRIAEAHRVLGVGGQPAS